MVFLRLFQAVRLINEFTYEIIHPLKEIAFMRFSGVWSV